MSFDIPRMYPNSLNGSHRNWLSIKDSSKVKPHLWYSCFASSFPYLQQQLLRRSFDDEFDPFEPFEGPVRLPRSYLGDGQDGKSENGKASESSPKNRSSQESEAAKNWERCVAEKEWVRTAIFLAFPRKWDYRSHSDSTSSIISFQSINLEAFQKMTVMADLLPVATCRPKSPFNCSGVSLLHTSSSFCCVRSFLIVLNVHCYCYLLCL